MAEDVIVIVTVVLAVAIVLFVIILLLLIKRMKSLNNGVVRPMAIPGLRRGTIDVVCSSYFELLAIFK